MSSYQTFLLVDVLIPVISTGWCPNTRLFYWLMSSYTRLFYWLMSCHTGDVSTSCCCCCWWPLVVLLLPVSTLAVHSATELLKTPLIAPSWCLILLSHTKPPVIEINLGLIPQAYILYPFSSPSVCLSVHLSVLQGRHFSLHLPACLPVHLSVFVSLYMSGCLRRVKTTCVYNLFCQWEHSYLIQRKLQWKCYYIKNIIQYTVPSGMDIGRIVEGVDLELSSETSNGFFLIIFSLSWKYDVLVSVCIQHSSITFYLSFNCSSDRESRLILFVVLIPAF